MKAMTGLLAALALASASLLTVASARNTGDAATAGPAAADTAAASETADDPADGHTGDVSDGTTSDEPAAPPEKPQPAEIEPLAVDNLMLDVVYTGKHLIAVGDRGDILASNDGKAWVQVPAPARAPLTAVSFADAENGWAVGHDAVILHTADGGRSWQLQNYAPALEKAFLDVLFLDPQRGFAVGAYGLFYKTVDGGAHWSEVDAPEISGDELHLYSIIRLGDGNLFIAGEQGLLGISHDDGATWTKLASPYEATLFSAVAHGDAGAVICGLRGNAFVTDNVETGPWKPIETGTKASFFGCSAIDTGHVAMAGLSGTVLVADLATATTTVLKSPVESAYSGVLKWADGLILVGENGIQRISMKP